MLHVSSYDVVHVDNILLGSSGNLVSHNGYLYHAKMWYHRRDAAKLQISRTTKITEES